MSARAVVKVGTSSVTTERGDLDLAALAKLADEQIRACGISGPKLRTLRAVIEHVRANPKIGRAHV